MADGASWIPSVNKKGEIDTKWEDMVGSDHTQEGEKQQNPITQMELLVIS